MVDTILNGITECSPLLLIERSSALEAALMANIDFMIDTDGHFDDFDSFAGNCNFHHFFWLRILSRIKFPTLSWKLDRMRKMTGYVVIFCAKRHEAIYLSQKLLQNGLLNAVYGERISQNRLSMF